MKENKGKEKCNALKMIRQEIALQNGIAFKTTECNFKGECKGTCPKCESEVRYLENELQKKGILNKKTIMVACSLPLLVACGGDELMGDIVSDDPSYYDSLYYDNDKELSDSVTANVYSELEITEN